MSFPNDVVEKALIQSGRHCCLCHKFCGFKIELHHIVPRAENGEDTFDNCIPLCFDCHAEVRAYDPKHPKGRKYTVAELKGHRDKWYEKVEKSYGTAVNPDYLQLDKALFLEIRKILPSDGSILYVRQHDYGGSFPRKAHGDLREFVYLSQRPECEFMDSDLEGIRVRLYETIDQFLNLLGEYTFPLDTDTEWNRVETDPHMNRDAIRYATIHTKSDEEFRMKLDDMSRRIIEQIDQLNQVANEICKTYDVFVRLGRRKLAV
jgi:hypothetical protein